MKSSDGQECKKDLCRQCITLVSRAPRIHSGHRSAALTVKIKNAILGEFRTQIEFQLLASQKSVLANHPASQRQKINESGFKDQNGVLFSKEEDILGRWRSIAKSFWTQSHPKDGPRRCIGGKIPSLQLTSS